MRALVFFSVSSSERTHGKRWSPRLNFELAAQRRHTGEVSEWLKAQHWKCCWRLKPSRGFESPPLRCKRSVLRNLLHGSELHGPCRGGRIERSSRTKVATARQLQQVLVRRQVMLSIDERRGDNCSAPRPCT